MKNLNYGIIGNCTTAALISSDCSIDWLCMPFFDSPSVFAKILDIKKGGCFQITAPDIESVERKYIPNTAILTTTFTTKSGRFQVRDYMPRFVNQLGKHYCPPEIHRGILPIEGTPQIKIILDPRPNYALGKGAYIIDKDYIKIISQKGEYNSFYFYTDLNFEKVLAQEPITIKNSAYFVLAYNEKIKPMTTDRVYYEYEKTKTYWLDWMHKTKMTTKHKDLYTRSAITLKLMTFQRTGAVIAAPTTSLPEIIGKDRNWDYRYCWTRDGSMIVDLYARMGHMNSSTRFIEFILNRMLLKRDNIAVMYGINGEKKLTEKSLKHLAGYENSKPVRIGNAAYRQKQNDLYGELIETIYTYFVINHNEANNLNEDIWTVVRSLVREIQKCWKETDSGIWEHRASLKHYVHSKLMNWVAMDRATRIAEFIGKKKSVDAWSKIADEIKADILKNGWNPKLKSFTMFYGSDSLDAANLLMLHYGFLDKNDPRIVSTVKQTYKYLVKDNLTFRYSANDDFGKPENAFIVCTFWMINALYLIGEKEKAQTMFDSIISHANDLGLFSEDIEIKSKRLTGNFPQGYSHLALIQTLLLLDTTYNWSDDFKSKKK